MASSANETRILIVAPTGADGSNMATALEQSGFVAEVCHEVGAMADRLRDGAGALVMTEEAIDRQQAVLAEALGRQAAWSDVPLVVITTNRTIPWWTDSRVALLGTRANITLVERPMFASTLVAAVKAVLRARRRQYEIRDLMQEREALLESLEARVVERTARLQELVAELEGFSYSVSHDLRAPLRVMAGYARAIREDHEETLVPEVKIYVERIQKTAERMDRLTQDVLAYTRVAREEIRLEPVDLERMLGDMIEQYPTLANARDAIRIRRPLAVVVGHEPSMVQVFSNLLENALKFVPAGRAPEVDVRTERRGGRVRILVRDNGVGIDPAHHAKIFGLFERVVPRHFPGTGIGLAIVKKRAERMGGTVGLSSEEGKGAEFWVELPAA